MPTYAESHRSLQNQFETRGLADALDAVAIVPRLDDTARAFIESRAFFFLTTVNPDGHPTVSHKGGAPGFVRAVDERTIVFPSYDGNGMFLSMGNIVANPKIGLLFIDFDTPNRLRVHADAVVSDDDPLMADHPGAELIVRATVVEAFPNCPRYITKQASSVPSKYVPDAEGHAPVASWKKVDMFQPALNDRDREKVAAEGGPISGDEYMRLFMAGEA